MADPRSDPGAPAGVSSLPPESFSALLSKEIERSRRYYRGFGLVRVGWQTGRAARAREDVEPTETGTSAAEAVARSLRRADLVASAPEGGGLYILLPETPASGVSVVSRRIEEALARSGRAAGEPGPVVREAAYPRDGETPDELLGALSAPRP